MMQEDDVQALRIAVETLEHPRLAARLTEIAGKPIELFNRALPETASRAIAVSTTQALNAALRVALRTMENEPKAASSYLHKVLAATSGAVAGPRSSTHSRGLAERHRLGRQMREYARNTLSDQRIGLAAHPS
jgi:hypothetical protein